MWAVVRVLFLSMCRLCVVVCALSWLQLLSCYAASCCVLVVLWADLLLLMLLVLLVFVCCSCVVVLSCVVVAFVIKVLLFVYVGVLFGVVLCCGAVFCVMLCCAVLVVLGRFVDSSLVVWGRLGGRCLPVLLVLGGLGGIFGPSSGALKEGLKHLGRSWGGLGGSLGRTKLLVRYWGRFLDRLGCPRGSQKAPQNDQTSIKKSSQKTIVF